MAITVEAVYENGVLKLSEPLPWKDGERVSVAVSNLDSPLLKAYGIMGWTGDAETIERIALDPEFLPENSLTNLASHDGDFDRVRGSFAIRLPNVRHAT